MIVTLKTVQNQQLTIEGMNENDNIATLKRRIADEKGYALDGLKIVFDGEILKDDNKTLAEVGVKEDNFVVILGRKEKKKPAPAKAEEAAPVSAQPVVQQPAPAPAQAQAVPSPAPAQAPAPAPVAQQEAPKPAPVQPQPAPQVQQTLPFGMTREQLDGMIASIMEMGFEKTEVEKCLRAAYYSPERAIEYLMSGIPAHLRAVAEGMPMQPSPQRQIPQQQFTAPAPASQPQTAPAPASQPAQAAPTSQPQAAPATAPAGAAATGPNSQLAALFRQMPNFEQMRSAVQSDPRLLRPILTTIASRNPELYAQITQNTQEFIQLLTQAQPAQAAPAPAGAQPAPTGMPAGMPPGLAAQMQAERPGTILISPQEKQAIDNLVAMGFDRVMAAQAYLTFKDENLAANFLLENQDFAPAGQAMGQDMGAFEGEMEEMDDAEMGEGEEGDQALYEEDFDDMAFGDAPQQQPPTQPQQPPTQPQQPAPEQQPQQPQQPPKPEEKKDEDKKMDEDKH